MKPFSLKKDLFLWLACLLPWITYGLVFSHLPARIPTHFDASGKVNTYSSPLPYVWTMFLAGLGIYLLLLLIPRFDPRKANYSLFSNTYWNIRLIVQVFFGTIACIPLLAGGGFAFQTAKWIPMLSLLMIALLGNYMGRIRPNWFVGIRTPWTLSNETVWRKTHLLGAKWMFGSAMAGLLLIPVLSYKISIWIMMACILVGAFVPAVYSYFLFHKMEKEDSSA